MISTSISHPDQSHNAAAVKREVHTGGLMASAGKRSLKACADSIETRTLNSRNVGRRASIVRELREKRSIKSSKLSS